MCFPPSFGDEVIKKTIATTISGAALTASGLVGAPALASVPQPTGTASIQMAADCAQYPGSVYTVTSLRLRKDQVERGEPNTAIVRVRAERGIPKGSVKITILPTKGDGAEVRLYQKLREGVAKVKLPTNLKRGVYGVQAKYLPKSCSKWAKSRSDIKYYRVTRRS